MLKKKYVLIILLVITLFLIGSFSFYVINRKKTLDINNRNNEDNFIQDIVNESEIQKENKDSDKTNEENLNVEDKKIQELETTSKEENKNTNDITKSSQTSNSDSKKSSSSNKTNQSSSSSSSNNQNTESSSSSNSNATKVPTCNDNDIGWQNFVANQKKIGKVVLDSKEKVIEYGEYAVNYGYGYWRSDKVLTYKSDKCTRDYWYVDLYVPPEICIKDGEFNPRITIKPAFSKSNIIGIIEYLKSLGYDCGNKSD